LFFDIIAVRSIAASLPPCTLLGVRKGKGEGRGKKKSKEEQRERGERDRSNQNSPWRPLSNQSYKIFDIWLIFFQKRVHALQVNLFKRGNSVGKGLYHFSNEEE
jgi:hypothetical protein